MLNKIDIDNFNNSTFGGTLGEKERNILKTITVAIKFNKNQVIYSPATSSDSIYFCKKGRIKLSIISKEGKEVTISLINPGELFGETVFIDDNNRAEYSISLDNSVVYKITKNDFQNFLLNTNMNFWFTNLIGNKLALYLKKIEELTFKDASQRVASFLLKFSDAYGEKIGSQILTTPFLKHQEIA